MLTLALTDAHILAALEKRGTEIKTHNAHLELAKRLAQGRAKILKAKMSWNPKTWMINLQSEAQNLINGARACNFGAIYGQGIQNQTPSEEAPAFELQFTLTWKTRLRLLFLCLLPIPSLTLKGDTLKELKIQSPQEKDQSP